MLNLGLGGLVGFALGLGLLIARGQSDRSYRSSEALERDLDLPILATLPPPDSIVRGVPAPSEPGSLRWEAVRNLRTNLAFREDAIDVRVLAVTATTTEEYSGNVAFVLAAVYAEAGYRTLLVEANLRQPQIASELDLEPEITFNALLDGGDQRMLGQLPSLNENLFLLVASRDSTKATELLSGSSVQSVLALLRAEFDVVIVSAASVLPFADARSVCALADGVILTTSYGGTLPEQIEAARESLDLVGAPLIGTVFDGVPVSRRTRREHQKERQRPKHGRVSAGSARSDARVDH
jgi:Mrp family chromosome partitioning ATPase